MCHVDIKLQSFESTKGTNRMNINNYYHKDLSFFHDLECPNDIHHILLISCNPGYKNVEILEVAQKYFISTEKEKIETLYD